MIDVVVKEIWIPAAPQAAFGRFTGEIDTWWPRSTHSVCGDDGVGVRFESGVGGRIVETDSDGREYVWGTVEEWDEPHCVAFSWHPGKEPEMATFVTVKFRAERGGTALELEHHGWEILGEVGPEVRDNYQTGWEPVLAEYGSTWSEE